MTDGLLNDKYDSEIIKASVKNNIERIRVNIANAFNDRFGYINSPKEATIVAATKTVPAEIINYAIEECGITDIGENRVQELLDKYPLLKKDKLRIHFIGHLQTNKVKYIADKVCMIQSLDSIKLAEEINRQCSKLGKVMDVLVEVNIGNETQKHGITKDEVSNFFDNIRNYEHIRPCGIMTIAPFCESIGEYEKFFKETYQIFIDICEKKLHNIDVPVLSMGMSSNYSEAIKCGSNMVRPGTAIFGTRK